jgi:hypothetical protein
MRKKSLLFLIAVPLVLSGALWGMKRKRDNMPAVILARYPQDPQFRQVVQKHLERTPASMMMQKPPVQKPFLLTSYFHGGSTNVIGWGTLDMRGYGSEFREVVNWAFQASHDFRLNAREMVRLHALLATMPPSDPPHSRADLLLVSFESKASWNTRIYNKKAVPAVVKQVLAFTGQKLPFN